MGLFSKKETVKLDVTGMHCQKCVARVKEALEGAFPNIHVILMETRGLDSFYAERHGLIVGF